MLVITAEINNNATIVLDSIMVNIHAEDPFLRDGMMFYNLYITNSLGTIPLVGVEESLVGDRILRIRNYILSHMNTINDKNHFKVVSYDEIIKYEPERRVIVS